MYLKENAVTLLEVTTGVDMNAGATTNLYTVPAGKSCIITHVVCKNPSISLDTARWSFGFDANGSDCIADALHVALDGSTKYIVLKAEDGAVIGVAAGIFKIKVNTAQGAAATMDIEVFGYLY